jgi:isoleucyl-tRNA synthetase
MIYVNGEFRGEWLSGKTKHPEQQFLNTKFIYACKGQVRKAAQKMSKKRRKDLGIDLDKKVEYFTPTWTSIKSLIRHLKKIDGLTIVEAE